MDSEKKKVEAVLFAVGKEITTERIASLCSLKEVQVEKIMEELIEEYNNRNHSLQIVKKDNGWKLTVRDEYVPLVSNIVSSTELERPLMETLAVIAWKYPIVQSDVVKLRSPAAYDHMRQLVEQGFIAKERFGRTFRVKLTNKFFEYFDLPSEKAKQAFLDLVPKEVLEDAEEVEKEADEVERLIELEEQEKSSREEIKQAMKGFKVEEKVEESDVEESDVEESDVEEEGVDDKEIDEDIAEKSSFEESSSEKRSSEGSLEETKEN